MPSDFFKSPRMDPPNDLSAAAVVTRIIDGLGYRLYGALDGLTEADCDYHPSDDAMSISQIIHHLWGLMNWMTMEIRGGQMSRPADILAQGADVLSELEVLRVKLAHMPDAEFAALKFNGESFWHGLDRPLCDMLHHSGQISILRRAAGNPNPRSNK